MKYENVKEAFMQCDADKLINEYSKILSNEDNSEEETLASAKSEIDAALERIRQTQPKEKSTEGQDVLVVCKSYDENGSDTFCVNAKDIVVWKSKQKSNVSTVSDEINAISDEMLTFMSTDDILKAAMDIEVPEKYAIEFCKWEEILGWKLADLCIAWYGLEYCVAHVLWEMTFFGVDPAGVEKATEEIHTRLEEAKKDLDENGEHKRYITIDELAMKILGDAYDENWYPEEERERDRRNTAISSYKMNTDYYRIISNIEV